MPHMTPSIKPRTYEGKPCRNGHGTTRYTAGGACIVCSKASSKARRDADPAAWRVARKSTYDPEIRRDYQLKAKYGMSRGEYDNMFEAQGGKCDICGKDNGGRSFSVDHDHLTGNVRALLCQACNVGIGALQDDPNLVAKAEAYLRKHGRI